MADHQTENVTETKVCSLTCIDLSNSDIDQSVALMKRACMDLGIFYVINHGVSDEFMTEVFFQIKKFFELPLNLKLKFPYNERNRGYQQSADCTESFTVGAGVLADHDPRNVWPPTDVLSGWKEIIQEYHRKTLDVGRAIMKIIALALDINADFFDQPKWLGGSTNNFSALIHYGVPKNEPIKEILGSIAHTDSGFLTLLATEAVLGLQICSDIDAKPQVWENVQPLKGAFIVNVADMLERLTNGAFKSIWHRVVYSQERYSTAMFITPSHDTVIECLPTCKSEENPPKYPAVTCEEFLRSRFEKYKADYERENNTKT